MRRIIFLVLLAFLVPVNAQVYRWLGEEGSVHFSDQPHPGAEVVMPQVVHPSAAGIYALAPVPSTQAVPGIVVYRRVSIVEPEYGATIRDNRGVVDVVVEVEPQLDTEAGDLIQILLDRSAFGEPSQFLERELHNVDRGRHLVGARIINHRGRRLISSRPVTFYLHRERVEESESASHSQFAALFVEEAWHELSRSERARLRYATPDEYNELVDKLVPAFIEGLNRDKRQAFIERFVPRLAEQLHPAEGRRVIKHFMSRIAGRLKPGDRPAFTAKIIEVFKEHSRPESGEQARFATSEYQKAYWDQLVSLTADQLNPAERARLRYLANPEQRIDFIERFVPTHLERLKPHQQQRFMEQFIPMFAAQLRPDRRQAFMEEFVQTSMKSVHPEEQGEFVAQFIQRGVRSVIPERRRTRYEDRISPEERDGYSHGTREERRKRFGQARRPEERDGYSRGIPEQRKKLRKQARRDEGLARHQQAHARDGSLGGRSISGLSPERTASKVGFQAGPPQRATPSSAGQPPPGGGSGLFASSTGR